MTDRLKEIREYLQAQYQRLCAGEDANCDLETADELLTMIDMLQTELDMGCQHLHLEADLRKRIEELESENKRLRKERLAFAKAHIEAEAQLEKVRGLRERREGILHGKYQRGYIHGWNAFLDELQQYWRRNDG